VRQVPAVGGLAAVQRDQGEDPPPAGGSTSRAKSLAMCVKHTPILPRRFKRESPAFAQATRPAKRTFDPFTSIEPSTGVPAGSTRISSAQKPPDEMSMVKEGLWPTATRSRRRNLALVRVLFTATPFYQR
jgi:hypothetical protein